jgi:hypothetical protein
MIQGFMSSLHEATPIRRAAAKCGEETGRRIRAVLDAATAAATKSKADLDAIKTQAAPKAVAPERDPCQRYKDSRSNWIRSQFPECRFPPQELPLGHH